MKYYPWLCMNGTEIAFGDRTQTYIRNNLVSNAHGLWSSGNNLNCDMLREGDTYIDPATDDAPWYDPTKPYSAEFLGIMPDRIDVLSVHERAVTKRAGGGGIIGPHSPKPRLLQFTGKMIASTEQGMAYGDRWLNEVLAGSDCVGCAQDEVLILNACSTDLANPNLYLRRMLDAALIDGPVIKPQGKIPECSICDVTFQIMAGRPHLFSPPIEVLPATELSASPTSPTCALITTSDWTGDAVAVITIKATSAGVSGIRIEGKPTFNGMCPWVEGEPCWSLDISNIPLDGAITIDPTREQIRYFDPSSKVERTGLPLCEFDGPLTFPEVSPCSQFCVCAYTTTGTAQITVDQVIREW